MADILFWIGAITFMVGFDARSNIDVVWKRVPVAVMVGLFWWLWMLIFLVMAVFHSI